MKTAKGAVASGAPQTSSSSLPKAYHATPEPAESYAAFLAGKRPAVQSAGFDVDPGTLNPALFDFQAAIVQWALRRGRAAIWADTGLGKAQPIDEVVLTPDGWRRIGDLQAGDSVIGANGHATKVLRVFPQGEREIVAVIFSDGARVRCDRDHLWAVTSDRDIWAEKPYRVLTTEQIRASGLMLGQGRARWRVPVVAPVDFSTKALPIAPYVLGVLLADGSLTSHTIVFTPGDAEIAEHVASFLPDGLTVHAAPESNKARQYAISLRAKGRIDNPYLCALREMGIHGTYSIGRFIPPIYLLGHKRQRIELLQGLLDCDGYISSDSTIQYGTSSEQLMEGVTALVRSLGGIVRVSSKMPTYKHDGEARIGHKHWTITIALPNGIPPFKLARKAARFVPRSKYPPTRKIVAIEEAGFAECVCIAVADETQLYVTRDYIVTHNTLMQCEVARQIVRHTGGNALILAPLAVAKQTVGEAAKFGITVRYCRHQSEVQPGITIANYEMLEHFTPGDFTAFLLDEASILKAFGGITRKAITAFGATIPYRFTWTATPAPNDLVELCNQSEYLNIMSGKEIIALYFTQDGNTTHSWRLKGHAKEDFYSWLATWAVAARKPSDLGFDDTRFILPVLTMHQRTVCAQLHTATLFAVEAQSLQERQAARRDSIAERVAECAALVNGNSDQWLIWCGLNRESEAVTRAIPGAVEVTGSDSIEHKEQSAIDFAAGKIRVLVSKGSIFGLGLNFQSCHKMAFLGLSDSFETQYQAIRRCWRFGQTKPVDVYVITSEAEGAVIRNIERKAAHVSAMMDSLVRHMKDRQMGKAERMEMAYEHEERSGTDWRMILGDSVETVKRLEAASVGLVVTSPPFPGMYAYSNSARDIGNTTTIDEMIEHFRYLVGGEGLLRVVMPGRMCAIHLMQLTAMKSREGYIGLHDYRGRVIEMMIEAGWVYAGEVTIDKNPQVQAVRNKERGLLFKSLATDSAMMRMALADYLIYFRKPGENTVPIRAGQSPRYNADGGWISEQEWIEWAAPVWYRAHAGFPGGIRETDVLNVQQARETDDERHLCPLQIGVIERAVKLWSAPGDLVLDPFAGIGSVLYQSLLLHRRAVGLELKRSYYETCCQNAERALSERTQGTLFDGVAS